MNPDSRGEVIDLNLPSPSLGASGKVIISGQENPLQPSTGPALLNVATAQPMTNPATPVVTDLSQLPSTQSNTTNTAGLVNTQQIDDTLVADDGDRIEKAWVIKAKEIVNQTKGDPYSQTQAMGRFRAEYIKKRYNKDIKLNED